MAWTQSPDSAQTAVRLRHFAGARIWLDNARRQPPAQVPGRARTQSPLRRWWSQVWAGLVAGLALLPSAVAVCMSTFYFSEWPSGKPSVEMGVAVGAGVALWVVVSTLFLRGYGR